MLDISVVAPIFKYDALIEKYDALKPGQSFVLTDNQSLTVYYYLLSDERGANFDWEPLEGPGRWQSKVVKRQSAVEIDTIGAIVGRNYRKAQALIKRDIDFSFGGNRTLSQALTDHKATINEVLQEWEAIDQQSNEGLVNYQDWNLALLTNYISKIHHKLVINQTAFITDMAFKVAASNSGRHPEIKKVAEIFAATGKLFERQVDVEEKVIFPTILAIARPEKSLNEDNNQLKNAIFSLKAENKDVIDNLRQVRLLTNNYAAPVYTSSACKILYKLLAGYESDALLHFHLENNILFPKALRLKKDMIKRQALDNQ